jgi:mono/diheme cytochrome c family protein
MMKGSHGKSWQRLTLAAGIAGALIAALAFTDGSPTIAAADANADADARLASEPQQASMQQMLRGRQLVLEHACGGCHGGAYTPDGNNWMAGVTAGMPGIEFLIGPCAFQPGAQPCFRTRPRNLTPDNLTGMGRFTERQIFNALRFGLRPGETADVDITSTTPGQGNFPMSPKYMAPPMPWPAWRHMPDEDLRAIAAYLKHGLKPVRNVVEDSEGPPDFWNGDYAGLLQANPYPAPAFPTANEVRPAASVDLQKVLRGRQVVIQHDCGACHGGFTSPTNNGWLTGVVAAPAGLEAVEFPVSTPDRPPVSGPCSVQPAGAPCWMMRPRNLTPHATTGTGRYTDRQLFNALRYGLRPSTSPDVVITSSVPGRGNFPANPDYLGIAMPWPALRYMSDDDLWAVIAYLKHGLRPVENKVADSDAPTDKWASMYTVQKIGPYPAPAFPTANEVRR